MRIIDLQKKYYKSLSQLDFDLILVSAIGKPKEFIFTHPEYPISILQYLRSRWFVHRYKKGYSVAAITKHKEFYGLDFFVNKHTLIPRPDTELMVTEAIEEIKNPTPCPSPYRGGIKGGVVLIDVGAGSGCIPIAILKNLTKPITAYAIDISRSALRVAKKNAKTHGVKINFLRGNLLEPILKTPSYVLPLIGGGNEDGIVSSSGLPSPIRGGIEGGVIITANLPYLTEQQFQDEPSIQREPKKALVTKNNGLVLYEELLKQIASLISNPPAGRAGIKYPIFILFEIDPSQSESITKLIKQYLPESNLKIKKDLAGRDRLVKIF